MATVRKEIVTRARPGPGLGRDPRHRRAPHPARARLRRRHPPRARAPRDRDLRERRHRARADRDRSTTQPCGSSGRSRACPPPTTTPPSRSFPARDATRVVWIADFLPDAMAEQIDDGHAGRRRGDGRQRSTGSTPTRHDRPLDRPRPHPLPGDVPRPARPLAHRPGAGGGPLAAGGPQHPRRGHRPPPHAWTTRPAGGGAGDGDAGRHRRRGARRGAAADWPVLYLSPRGRPFDPGARAGAGGGPGRHAPLRPVRGDRRAGARGAGGRGGQPRRLRDDRRRDRGNGLDRRHGSAYRRRPRECRLDGGGILRRRALGVSALYAPDRMGRSEDTRGSPLGAPRTHRRVATLPGGEADKERRPDLWRAYLAKAGQADPAGEAELSDAHTTAATGGHEKDEGDEPDR